MHYEEIGPILFDHFLVSGTSDVFTKAAYQKSRYRLLSVVKK